MKNDAPASSSGAPLVELAERSCADFSFAEIFASITPPRGHRVPVESDGFAAFVGALGGVPARNFGGGR